MLACIPDVLSRAQVASLRALLDGLDFEDGRATAGFRAKRVKHNEQARRDAPAREQHDRLVLDALRANAEFQRLALPRSIQRPMFCRYRQGMNYGLHVDDALMGREPTQRTDVSVTVFLSQPTEYDGGALEIHSPYGPQEVKLPAGSAVVYPAGTLHQVAPVTRGERLTAVTWAQSHVRDQARRELLADLDCVRRRLGEIDPDGETTNLSFKSYANLLRMWSDT